MKIFMPKKNLIEDMFNLIGAVQIDKIDKVDKIDKENIKLVCKPIKKLKNYLILKLPTQDSYPI